MNFCKIGPISVNVKPPLTTFEECPKCGQTIISTLPANLRRCCNKECRHEWETKK